MAKLNIKLNSPKDTPEDEKVYVIEYPVVDAVNRVKVRKQDIERELAQIDVELTQKNNRKTELEAIQSQINKIK